MSALLQISAGRGPIEVRHFVGLLAPLLVEALRRAGGVVSGTLAENPASVTLTLDDRAADAVSNWLGVHTLVAPLRGRGHRKRWFAEVTLHTPPDAHHLGASGINLKATRAGGPGGQNVNKRATAVRAVDLGTGIGVRVTAERSQRQNRQQAMTRLGEKVAAVNATACADAEAERWARHQQLRRGAAEHTWKMDGSGGLRRM